VADNERLPSHDELLHDATSVDYVRQHWSILQTGAPYEANTWSGLYGLLGDLLLANFSDIYRQTIESNAAAERRRPEIVAARWFLSWALQGGKDADHCLTMLDTITTTGGWSPKPERPILDAWNKLVAESRQRESWLRAQDPASMTLPRASRVSSGLTGSVPNVKFPMDVPTRAPSAPATPASAAPQETIAIALPDLTDPARQVMEQVERVEGAVREVGQIMTAMLAQAGDMKRFLGSLPPARPGMYVSKADYDRQEPERLALQAKLEHIERSNTDLRQMREKAEAALITQAQSLTEKYLLTASETSQQGIVILARTIVDWLAALLEQTFEIERVTPKPGERFDRERMFSVGGDLDKARKNQEYEVVWTIAPGFRRRGGPDLTRPYVKISPINGRGR
jgi:hypothetical protein